MEGRKDKATVELVLFARRESVVKERTGKWLDRSVTKSARAVKFSPWMYPGVRTTSS